MVAEYRVEDIGTITINKSISVFFFMATYNAERRLERKLLILTWFVGSNS